MDKLKRVSDNISKAFRASIKSKPLKVIIAILTFSIFSYILKLHCNKMYAVYNLHKNIAILIKDLAIFTVLLLCTGTIPLSMLPSFKKNPEDE